MKTIIIGRDESCDVVIIDRTNVASRRHAVINIDNLGRMTITDHSSNGTYINGIRMSESVPVPVTRRDVISFAQVSDLNWSLIPNIKQRNFLILGASLAVVAIAVILLVTLNKKTDNPLPQQPTPVTTVTTPPVNKDKLQEKAEPKLQNETPSVGVESDTDDEITIIKKKKTEEKTNKKTNKNKDKAEKKEETAPLEKEKEIDEQDKIDDKEVKTETKTEAETKTEVDNPKEKKNKTLVDPIIL